MKIEKLNTLTKRVEHVLRSNPETRNNDIELQAAVLMTFYPPLERPIYNWMDYASVMKYIPSLDHIARARRKVIGRKGNEYLLPTNPNVALARGFSEAQWQQWAAQPDFDTGEDELLDEQRRNRDEPDYNTQ